MKGLLSLLFVCALLLSSLASNEIRSVLCGEDPARFQQVWIDNQLGLILLRLEDATSLSKMTQETVISLATTGSPLAIVIGLDASEPVFDKDGSLIFEITTDDGFILLSRNRWALPYLSKYPMHLGELRVNQPATIKEKSVKVARDVTTPIQICIDPGHGGNDPGAVAQGYQEADLNLDISLRLRDLLDNDDGRWTTLMTRTTNTNVSLSARTTLCNSWPGDRFVSIHCNSFTTTTAKGTETYSYQTGTTAAQLRDTIQSKMIEAWGLANRGSKTANFYVLKYTTMPATLSELGFISSPIDILKLQDPDARQQAAAAHLEALRVHFGFV